MWSYMIFSSNVTIQPTDFLNNYKTICGSIKKVMIDKSFLPSIHSSIDLSSKLAVIKYYNEYLERTRMGFCTVARKDVQTFNSVSNESILVPRRELGYGNNLIFGRVDTTGTASGICSKKIKQKALSELLEKNELMLMWYGLRGRSVKIDQRIQDLFQNIGLHSENIFLFASKNISSGTAIVAVLFHRNKVVASGVSLSHQVLAAVRNAVLEAKLLERIFRENTISPYYNYSNEQHESLLSYCTYMRDTMEPISLNELCDQESQCLVTADWIKDIRFAVLNTHIFQETLTIRCISKDLLNCIPTKPNIERCLAKNIVVRFGIKKQLTHTPNCIVL